MIKAFAKKALTREIILYLFFGVLAVLLNIVLFYLFVEVAKMPVWLGNILDTLICVLFQYFTNRIWVFQSQSSGKAAVKEFYQFLLARAITALIDQLIVVVGIGYFVKNFIAASEQTIYKLAVKIFSNLVVIVLNYIFSKKIIFKKAEA